MRFMTVLPWLFALNPENQYHNTILFARGDVLC